MRIDELIKFLEKQPQNSDVYINIYNRLVIKTTTHTYYALTHEGIEELFRPSEVKEET